MARRWSEPLTRAASVLTLLMVCAAGWGVAAADGRLASDPFWFADDYTGLAFVDPAATTATVDTGGSGTVRLPSVPVALAFSPPPLRIALVAAPGGVRAWAWDGSAMVRAPSWDVAAGGEPIGAAWLGSGPPLVAVATPQAITVYGRGGAAWSALAARGSPPELVAVAAGPGTTLAAATATGLSVLAWDGRALVPLPAAGVTGLAGVRGLATAAGGRLAALSTRGGLRVYGWDGAAYREAAAWEPPAGGPPAPLAGVVWFGDGAGYWLAAGGALRAYAWSGTSLRRWAAADVAAVPAPTLALATGWGDRAVAALGPSGWSYFAWDGRAMRHAAAWDATGLRLPAYRSSAVLQSAPLPVGHPVDQLRLEPAVSDLPPGTAIAWSVSTDGCASWQPIAPFRNLTVPPGEVLCYRAVLSSDDAAATPVLDRTDLFEIATRLSGSADARAVLVR